MIKTMFSVFILVSFTALQTFAAPQIVFQLKDLSIQKVSSSKMSVNYKGSEMLIEKVDTQRFKVNNQVVLLSTSDTLEQLENKIRMAYQKGQKRSAALDQLFMSKAHAITPLFAGAIGAFFGFAIGDSMCKNRGGNQSQQAQEEMPIPIPAEVSP